MNGIRNKNFFLHFSAYLISFWQKIMSERGFFNFSNFFCYFFRNFLVWVEYERNSGVKFFSLFLGLSRPVLAKNNIGNRFFNFFNFFCYFSRNFHARVEFERNSEVNFFFSFLAYLIPFWLKIMSESGF